jgi:hypothetical protein
MMKTENEKKKMYAFVSHEEFQGDDAKSIEEFSKEFLKKHGKGRHLIGQMLQPVVVSTEPEQSLFLVVSTCHTCKRIVGMAPVFLSQLKVLPETALEADARAREKIKLRVRAGKENQ